MSSTSQGSILAGRYRLERRIQTDPDGSLWRARDSTLDRLVCVRVLRPGHPFAADVVDAARRAALVDDPRLVRVLDVGHDGNVSFVVTEHVNGETLAAATERAPLSGPAIRRVVGEVSEGLAGAAGRGLHHLRLTPRSVMIRPDGSVKVLGTATEAAAAGLEPDHAASANRVDAVGLIALVYSGLTGRWPLGDAGFPPAPHGHSGPMAPAELMRGIPGDLDTLCAVTLGPYNDGPRSPAEVARQLAPWPSAAEVTAAEAAAGTPRVTGETFRPASIVDRSAGSAGSAASGPPADPAAGNLFTSITPVAADTIRDARAAAARGSSSPNGAAGAPPTLRRVAKPAGTSNPRRTPAATPPGAGPARPPATRPPEGRPPAGRPPAGRDRPNGPVRTPLGSSGPAGSGGHASRPAPPAAGPLAAEPSRQQPSTASGGRRNSQRRPAGSQSIGDSGELLMPWAGTWTTAESNSVPAEATGPFPILIPADQPPREQSRLVLAGVAAALIVGLVLAVFSLRNFGAGGDDQRSSAVAPLTSTSKPSSATATPATRPAQTPAASASPSPSATPAASPPAIAAIRAIDPQGDNDENTPDSVKAVDGVASTSWSSDTYKSAAFGGLKKGLGLAIKLKAVSVISSVAVDVTGSGGTLELRGGGTAAYQDSTLLDTAAVNGGTVNFIIKAKVPYRYVILWFTKLPTASGEHRAEVAEVRVK